MIINFFAGMLTGFLISIPPLGPIAFAMISRGFKNEAKEGRAVASGAAFMDFFYSFIAFSGMTLIFSFFPSGVGRFYAENAQPIEIGLTFTGCAIVILYGLKIIRKRISYDKLEAEESAKLESALEKAIRLEKKAENAAKHLKLRGIKKPNLVGLFFMGVLLCLSSLTLPASWIAIVGYLKGYRFLESSLLGSLLFSMGAFTGTFAWYFTLLQLITGNRHRINQKTINKLNTVAGVTLIGLGALLFARAVVAVVAVI